MTTQEQLREVIEENNRVLMSDYYRLGRLEAAAKEVARELEQASGSTDQLPSMITIDPFTLRRMATTLRSALEAKL